MSTPSPQDDDDLTQRDDQTNDKTVEDDIDDQTVVEPISQDIEPTAEDATVILPSQAGTDSGATVADPNAIDGRTVFEDLPEEQTVIDPVLQESVGDAVVAEPSAHGDDSTLASQTDDEDSQTFISSSMPAGQPAPNIRTLDRFELLRVLGQGAFGTVYLGRDPRLDRQVAIKVAKTGVLNSKTDIDRFNREARAAAQLRHPNIVPVYEAGQLHGSSYIVHDFIEGQTLKQLLKTRGKLPPKEAASTMIQIARALDYAHSHGIIHRDIKPENILIDKAGEPHIADFGLARNEEKDSTRTREGTLMGTPAYMSPEQASGKVSQVDRRSDVWSLGIMLDEMLTARRIFSGTVVEVLTAVQSDPIKPLRSVDASLPIDLETICLKALEKNQATRFQTAGQLARELELWSNGEPITLRRIGYGERLYRWAKRNQTVAALLATVFATLVLGTVISTWFGYDASRKAEQLEIARDARRDGFMQTVLTAEPEAVSTLLKGLDDFDADSELLERLELLESSPDERETRRPLLVMRMAGDGTERQQALDKLRDALLREDPREFLMLRRELLTEKQLLVPRLWQSAEDANASYDTRLHAAAALALYDSKSPRWGAVTDSVVSQLLADSLHVASWSRALAPVREQLKGSLLRVFGNPNEPNKKAAGSVLASLFADSPEVLIGLVDSADSDQLGVLVSQLRKHPEAATALSKRLSRNYPEPIASLAQEVEDQERANNVIGLLQSGQVESANKELSKRDRNGVRAHVIDRAAKARLNQSLLFRSLLEENNPACLRTAILSLAEYSEGDIDQPIRNQRAQDLLRLYRNHPDAGVHGAIEYLMRKWNLTDQLEAASKELRSANWPAEGRNWHHSSDGIVFAIIRNPPEFLMGTDDPIRGNPLPIDETPHPRTVGRSYAISLYEVTVEQFQAFDQKYEPKYSPSSGQTPASSVNWWRAATFCNWLSRREGVDDDSLCYTEPKRGGTVSAFSDVVQRNGYRLPTRAEWEYAARCGTDSLRHFGGGRDLLSSYAWFAETASAPQPVGQLLPNEFGLFDSLGNVREWLQTWAKETNPALDNLVDGDEGKPGQYRSREYAGGSYFEVARDVLEAARYDASDNPISKYRWLGFRIARTIPPAP